VAPFFGLPGISEVVSRCAVILHDSFPAGILVFD